MEKNELEYRLMKMEYIILQMKHELDKTREIVHRYYLRHGSEMSTDKDTITDSMEYDIIKNQKMGIYSLRIADLDDNSTNKLFCDIVKTIKK